MGPPPPEKPGKRSGQKPRRPGPVRDWHLWTAVSETVDPLIGRKTADPRSIRDGLDRGPREPGPSTAPSPAASPRFGPAPAPSPAIRPMAETRRGGQAHRPIEPNLKRRLDRGHLPIDATLDLHGMTQAQARDALFRFVPARAKRGDRTILVITGKGLKKTGYLQIAQKGVLRTMVPIWLTEPELSQLVAGWEPAHQAHGGEGALYVRLKRKRGAVS